jgi:ADP-ribose pyrophosphatase YjhB (NUDIX family)
MILQVGVKIFLRNQDGKYLLMRRSPEKYPDVKGEWDIPGGRINPGSLLIENLRREVKEETQLEIISEPKLIYAQDIIPNEEKHVVRLSYVGETRGEPILDTSENVEYKWLSLNELKNYSNVDIYAKKIIDSAALDKYLE